MAKNIEFTGKREYLFERDAVRFAAIVDGHPTWCVIAAETITAGDRPCSNSVDLLSVFDARFHEMEAAAKRKIEKIALNDEVAIVQADLAHR